MSSASPRRRIGVFATISSCSGSLVTTMSSALVAIEPGATPLTRTLGAQSAASRRVMCASAALAVPYATYPRSRNRPIADVMLTTEPLPDSSRWGSAARVERERGAHVEVERALEGRHVGVDERHRHRAADVVHDDVEPAELVDRGVDQALDRAEIGEVGGHDDRAATELLRPARRRRRAATAVRAAITTSAPRLGEGERRRGADAAPGGGDDGDAVVETEAVQEHAGTLPGRYVARMTVPTVDDQPTPAQLDALYDALQQLGPLGRRRRARDAQLPHPRAAGRRRASWCAAA